MKKIKHSKIISTKKLNINHALINIILNIDIHIKLFFTQRQNIIAYFNILANLLKNFQNKNTYLKFINQKIKIDMYIFVNGFFEHLNHLT